MLYAALKRRSSTLPQVAALPRAAGRVLTGLDVGSFRFPLDRLRDLEELPFQGRVRWRSERGLLAPVVVFRREPGEPAEVLSTLIMIKIDDYAYD